MDDRSPISDRLRRIASRYEASVSHGRAEQLAARAVARVRTVPRQHHRVAAAVVGSAFTIVVLSGLAVAAESAVPGDLLYPVDRAVEALGLDRNLLEERLEEAIVLADRGDRERVVLIAGEVLDEVNRSGVPVVRTAPTSAPIAAAIEDEAGGAGSESTESSDGQSGPVPSTQASIALASPEPAAEDPVAMIRLEAENLLRTVRQAKSDPAALDELGVMAGSLADAVDAASVTTTSSTTTTAPASSSTTTASSSTTSTTTSTSSTTSTTVDGDGGGDDGSEPGDGNGSGSGDEQPPITLPQP